MVSIGTAITPRETRSGCTSFFAPGACLDRLQPPFDFKQKDKWMSREQNRHFITNYVTLVQVNPFDLQFGLSGASGIRQQADFETGNYFFLRCDG